MGSPSQLRDTLQLHLQTFLEINPELRANSTQLEGLEGQIEQARSKVTARGLIHIMR